MRRIVICTGVLGGGTALTFVAAAIASALSPTGPLVYTLGQSWARPMPAIDLPMPAPAWGGEFPVKEDPLWGPGLDGGGGSGANGGTDEGTIILPSLPPDIAPGG